VSEDMRTYDLAEGLAYTLSRPGWKKNEDIRAKTKSYGRELSSIQQS